MNENNSNEALHDDVMPVSLEDRTLTGPSTFVIWFACNLVVTTILTGMLMIPELSFSTALILFFLGSAIGIIPLVLVGRMGTKTGLTTMVMSRATFGTKGSLLPSAINVFILVAWSWAQAGLGGLALNYLSKKAFGFDKLWLYVIMTEVLVVAISLFAIKGIAMFEKVAMILIVAVIGAVIYKASSTHGLDTIWNLAKDNTGGLTAIAAFDIIVATALSWTPLSADYNRNCKTTKGSVLGASLGYTFGTTASMGVGALVIAMIIAAGKIPSYDPSSDFGAIGFGVAGSIVIFVSVLAANVMCVYSSTMSFLNVFPRAGFKRTILVIGAICTIGALFSGILDSFLNFVYLIGVLFMPLFAIMIADFYVLRKQKYNVNAIVDPGKYKDYHYSKGFNIKAIVVYFISAALAYVFSSVYPLPTGATIPSFIFAFLLYIIVSKAIDKGAQHETN